jgi:predicted Rossmann-fold nucleotide-binding protein
MKVAIIGSTNPDSQEIIKKSQELGRLIASKGHIVVTGGVSGYPDIVALSAISSKGKAIAYCAGKNLDDHKKLYQTDLSKYSETIFQEKYIGDSLSKIDLYIRSLKLCFDVDIAIVIGGRVGTMYEITILAGISKDIYVLNESGGITNKTIKEFLKEGHKEKSKIEFFSSAEELEKFL